MFLKPFANEHSARIVSPSRFQPESFRRQNITKGIDIILARLKGETTLSTQAYRFQKDRFTVAESKKWLRDHDIEWILFEPATEKMLKPLYKANELPVPVKDVDSEKGTVKAYFAVFGNEDSDGDIIEAGAFSKSISERGPEGIGRIKHLKFHDRRLAPGLLLELGEDEFGGFFVSKLSKSTLGRDTLIEYQEKIITEHSHGFEVIKSHRDESNINHITESKLWEVSTLAAWGANHLTRTEFVKSLESEEEFLKALKGITDRLKIGSFSDDYLEQLEKAYAEMSAAYKSLTSKEPSNTQKEDEPRLEVLANLL